MSSPSSSMRLPTGGRPATMTRSAVLQGRTTQQRPAVPVPSIAIATTGARDNDNGEWVSVDHRRRHRSVRTSTSTSPAATAPNKSTDIEPTTIRAETTPSISSSASSPPPMSYAQLVMNGSGRKNGTPTTATCENPRERGPWGSPPPPQPTGGRDLRRAQSQQDAKSSRQSVAPPGPVVAPSQSLTAITEPVPTSHARADALSAAVAIDKKTREHRYTNHQSPHSPPLVVTTSPASPPSMAAIMRRSASTSPDGRNNSSLQKLMESWQRNLVVDAAPEQNRESRGTSANPRRTPGGRPSRNNDGRSTQTTLAAGSLPSPPPSQDLRRTQSDIVSSGGYHRVRASTAGGSSRQWDPTVPTNPSVAVDGSPIPGATQTLASTPTPATTPTTTTNPKKCGDKRDFFFRNLDYETRCRLQIDDVAAFSVTDFEMARRISLAIVEQFSEFRDLPPQETRGKYPLVITDGTACVGGNVLSFCDFFRQVHAVECDSTRVSMLENNLKVLGKKNVTCWHASYLDVMLEIEQDVVFIDPPWGGPEYKELDRVDLFLDSRPLYEICERLRGYTKCVVLKVPTNFDDVKFAANVSGVVIVRKDFKKMHLVVLDFRERSNGQPSIG